jgi:hypothetical protein
VEGKGCKFGEGEKHGVVGGDGIGGVRAPRLVEEDVARAVVGSCR